MQQSVDSQYHGPQHQAVALLMKLNANQTTLDCLVPHFDFDPSIFISSIK